MTETEAWSHISEEARRFDELDLDDVDALLDNIEDVVVTMQDTDCMHCLLQANRWYGFYMPIAIYHFDLRDYQVFFGSRRLGSIAAYTPDFNLHLDTGLRVPIQQVALEGCLVPPGESPPCSQDEYVSNERRMVQTLRRARKIRMADFRKVHAPKMSA